MEGKYASSSEIIWEALRDWQLKHGVRNQELEALRADVTHVAHGARDAAALIADDEA